MERVSRPQLKRPLRAPLPSRSPALLPQRVRGAYSSRTSHLRSSTALMQKVFSSSRSHITRVGQSTGNLAFKIANKLLHAMQPAQKAAKTGNLRR